MGFLHVHEAHAQSAFGTPVSELWSSSCKVQGADGSAHLALTSAYIPLVVRSFLQDYDLRLSYRGCSEDFYLSPW